MTREEAELYLRDVEAEPLFADGFDDCIVGICRSFDTYKVVYDAGKVLDKLCEDGMTEDEAREFYEFNIVGSYVGEGTPVFLEFNGIEL